VQLVSKPGNLIQRVGTLTLRRRATLNNTSSYKRKHAANRHINQKGKIDEQLGGRREG
jgi:hypothetical protein